MREREREKRNNTKRESERNTKRRGKLEMEKYQEEREIGDGEVPRGEGNKKK